MLFFKVKNTLFGMVFSTGMIAGAMVSAQTVSPETLVADLAPSAAGPVVTALKSQNALVIDPQVQIPTAFDLPSKSFSVEFDGETHILTADGMTTLRSVGLALQDERLSGQSFQVAGHYVSPNDPANAVRLSARRALTVAEHLQVFYGISANRLVPVGYGANAPVDPAAASSQANTRIQLINILSR